MLAERFVRQLPQEFVQTADLLRQKRTDRAVSELVVVNELLAAANEIAARLLAFPCRSRKEEVQRLPRLIEIEVGVTLNELRAFGRNRVGIGFLDRDRREPKEPS